ncbi:sodium:solute symporter [Alistipes sp. Z76]|nr:sodium:solute symporter [Alistipes sp. Z76]NCE68163.1 sodium:solute symporter [Muribaculaceae bacterium M3]
MSPFSVLLTLLVYLALLFSVAYVSGRGADNAGFFIGNRRTTWYMAALAMIGAAMSGVTFISVPGSVAVDSFSYMQMVVGFTIGQLIVAFVLVPVFYRRGVVSLYEYLDGRFGITSHKTGAWCFLVSKIFGASLKIYVVCAVMQVLVFDHFHLPFMANILFTMLLVWLYTKWGGVRSLILTDTLQSLCLVASIAVCIWSICRASGFSAAECYDAVVASDYSRMWFFDDPSSARYFWKMVAGGAFCLVAMTGLDQDMMQRNMSCRTVRDSQINIVLTALCQIVVILFFLVLGALLYIYIDLEGLPVPAKGDQTFAAVAVNGGLPAIAGIVFVVGLVSCTYSAAGSALTSLTTSFTLDILDGAAGYDEARLARLRKRIHLAMALVMTVVIVAFDRFGNDSVINLVFRVAGYTYGPILGLFVFGMACRRRIRERYVPAIAVLSPALSWALQWWTAERYGYHIGFELLGYNALFTILGLFLISYRHDEKVS